MSHTHVCASGARGNDLPDAAGVKSFKRACVSLPLTLPVRLCHCVSAWGSGAGPVALSGGARAGRAARLCGPAHDLMTVTQISLRALTE